MTALKLIAIGNSTGVILPREVLAKLKVDRGASLYLTETSDGYRIAPYDEEFAKQMEMARKIMREDRDVLHELAK